MVYDIVLGTVTEFIEWAQLFTLLFIAYYGFRFIFFSDGKEDEAWNKRGAELRQGVKKLIDERKEHKKKQDKLENRKKYLDKSSGFLDRALRAAQDLQERFHTDTPREIDRAKSGVGDLRSALSSARRNARGAHRHHEDDLTESLQKLHAAIDAVYDKIPEYLSDNIPKEGDNEREFRKKSAEFRKGANKIADYIASLYSSVRRYIEAHDNKTLRISAKLEALEREVAATRAQGEAERRDAARGQARTGATEEARDRTEAERQARAEAAAQGGGRGRGAQERQREYELRPVAKGKRRRR